MYLQMDASTTGSNFAYNDKNSGIINDNDIDVHIWSTNIVTVTTTATAVTLVI